MAKNKKEEVIKVRVSEKDKLEALNNATAIGLDVSSYIRMLIKKDTKKVD